MALRTIQSPGVEIREIDLSQYAPAVVGTTVMVNGFSDKGINYNPVEVTSLDEFETLFGKPSNEAERYFYYTSKEVIRGGGNLIATKLPYNNDESKYYKYIGLTIDDYTGIATDPLSANLVEITGTYFSTVKLVTADDSVTTNSLATSGYDVIVAGGAFPAAVSNFDFLIVDENKSRFAGEDNNEGIFVTFVDPVDALRVQRMLTGGVDADVMGLFQGISTPSGIQTTDFSNALTGTYIGTSVSEQMMRQFKNMEFTDAGADIDPSFAQHLGVLVCRTIPDAGNEGKLYVAIEESFIGSIHHDYRNPATGQSEFLGDIVNAGSRYIKLYRNTATASATKIAALKTNAEVILYCPDREYSLLGFNDAECAKVINGNTLVNDLKIVFERMSNIDEYEVDLVVDGGVSTIANFCGGDSEPTSGTIFDPVLDVDPDDVTIVDANSVALWRSVCMEYIAFCKDTRKDCMCILDTPRQLELQGNEKYIRKTVPTNTFSNTIGNKIRYVTGLNSSYAAEYADWTKAIDDFTGIPFWLPPTCKAGGIYVYNDRVGNIWDAPAGLNRGVINGIVDLAFNPNQKASDQLYTKSINYAKQYPLDGFILEGQKTTQAKPSAFDRVNVRRMFLRLERLTRRVARYFIMEPSNSYTRRRVIDVLTPIFAEYKSLGGIQRFEIKCDEENNPAEVVERNELKIMIMIVPTKSIEYILIDMVATRQDANFTETVRQLT